MGLLPIKLNCVVQRGVNEDSILGLARMGRGSCTRARLTLDGSLVTCLLATGGVDLRSPMRDGASDSEQRERIAGGWKVRADLEGHVKPSAKIGMYHIGG